MQIATALIADRMGALLNELVRQGRTPAEIVAHHNISQMPKVLASIASGALVGVQADEFIRHLQEAIGRDTQYFGRRQLVGNPTRMGMMTPQMRTTYLAQIYFAAFALEFFHVLGILGNRSTPASQAISQWLPLTENVQVANSEGSQALVRLSQHITIPANIFQNDVVERAQQVVVGLRGRDWLSAVAGSNAIVQGLNQMQAQGPNQEFDRTLATLAQSIIQATVDVATGLGVALPTLYPATVGGVAGAVAPVAPVVAAPVDARPILRQAVCVYALTTEGDVVLVTRPDSELHGLPGGKVEPGETLMEAAVREIEEELGVDIYEEDLVQLHVGICSDEGNPNWDGQSYLTTTFLLTERLDAEDLEAEDDDVVILLLAQDDEDIIEGSAFPEYNRKVVEAAAQMRRFRL